MDFFANPRPTQNSSMAKLSFIKWSQNMIFGDGSAISSTPEYLENCCF